MYIKNIAGDIQSPVPLPAECCANFLPPVGQGKPQPQPAIFWGVPPTHKLEIQKSQGNNDGFPSENVCIY